MSDRRRCAVGWAAFLASFVIGAPSCAPSTGEGPGEQEAVPNGGAPGTGGSGSPGTGSGTSVGGGGNPVGPGPVNRGGSPGTSDGGCFAASSKAEQVVTTVEVPVEVTVTIKKPLDMYIMYDKSGSMNNETESGESRWDAIKQALIGFVSSQDAQDVGVGIDYFPSDPPPCSAPSDTCTCFFFICASTVGGSCDIPAYGTPDVPIEPLPGVAQKIIDSVNRHRPGGDTPTTQALSGAMQYAMPWAQNHPDRKTIVVLATDGNPSGCSGNTVNDVASVAADAFNRPAPNVQTFVIGVGSSLTSLDAIAAAGGTTKAFIVDAAGTNATQEFIKAMNDIRETATITETRTEIQTQVTSKPVQCEWTIPNPPPNGIEFRSDKVNVEFSSGGGAPTRIGAVGSAAECSGVDQGWHYDNADAPTKVLVCPQTCDMVRGLSEARVDVVFGCDTEPAKIR